MLRYFKTIYFHDCVRFMLQIIFYFMYIYIVLLAYLIVHILKLNKFAGYGKRTFRQCIIRCTLALDCFKVVKSRCKEILSCIGFYTQTEAFILVRMVNCRVCMHFQAQYSHGYVWKIVHIRNQLALDQLGQQACWPSPNLVQPTL